MFLKVSQSILLWLALFLPLAANSTTPNKIVTFGDSLSDMGNLAAVPGFEFLNKPPYAKGFSNGEPAVVVLAKLMGTTLSPSFHLGGNVLGNNFAVAGAKAAGTRGIDLNAQIAAYLASRAGKAAEDTLYIMFLGGNDIRDMRNESNKNKSIAILNKAIGNINSALGQLRNAGARTFLVVNAPNIGKIPETRFLASKNPKLIAQTTAQTVAFNRKLAGIVQKLQRDKRNKAVIFDLFSFTNRVAANGKAYNYRDVSRACYSSESFGYYPGCSTKVIDSYFYFDEIHPTQRIHERVGRALFAVIPEY